MMIEKIVSGGQTGADRAALDFALQKGLPHGGWCPAGRRSEDGRIAEVYQLKETPSPDYIERTEWNVRDTDGTVIFSLAAGLQGGSLATADLAIQLARPWLHLSAARRNPEEAGRVLNDFIEEHRIRVLNVAGPRASNEPRVGGYVRAVLEAAL